MLSTKYFIIIIQNYYIHDVTYKIFFKIIFPVFTNSNELKIFLLKKSRFRFFAMILLDNIIYYF